MTERTASRREALGALGATAVGVLGAPTAAAQADPEVTVTIDPREPTTPVGDTVTVDIVIQGATEGIFGYEFTIQVDDPTVGTVTGFEEFQGQFRESEIIDDGSAVRFETALGTETYDGAEETAIGTVTFSGERVAQSQLTFRNESSSARVQDNNQNLYQTTTEPGTLVVEADERPLVSSFEVDPPDPRVGETVSFDASGSTGAVAAYNWTFGDGTTTSTDGVLVTHTYGEAGEYEVTLELEGADGGTDQTSRQVSVSPEPTGVEAVLELEPTSAQTGDVVDLDASGSTGTIVEYRWDVDGDGTVEDTTQVPEIVSIYDESGEYEVTVEVVGEGGDTDQTSESLSVTASDTPSPSASFEVEPESPQVGSEVTFDATGSTGDIVEYRWDFTGDGSTDRTTDGPTAVYTYEEPGSRTVRLELVGEDDSVDSATREVSVEEQTGPAPPSAAFEVTSTDPVVGETLTLDAADSEGDIVSYEWTFGDGSEMTTDEPTVTHSYDAAGTVTVELTVTDSADQTDTTTRSLDIGGGADDGSGNGSDGGTDDGSGNGSDGGTDDGSGNGSDGGTDDSTGDSSDGGADDGSGDGSDGGADDGSGDGSDGGNESQSDGTDDSSGGGSDGLGPGFGLGSAIAGVGGAVHLLRRRLRGDEER
jgi:PKD repeat protein